MKVFIVFSTRLLSKRDCLIHDMQCGNTCMYCICGRLRETRGPVQKSTYKHRQSFHTLKKATKWVIFPHTHSWTIILQSYQKVVLLQDTFFQWCNNAMDIWCDICAGKVIFWKVRSPAIKSIFLAACASLGLWMPVNYVLVLASRQRPNKVGVMIGMNRQAWEKQVLFIGSCRCAHCCGGLRLVEGRHHRSGRKLLMPGMFVGTGWPR